MKTVKRDDSSTQLKHAIYKEDRTTWGKNYWARLVTVCNSETGRTWRVTVYGNSVEGRLTQPLIQRVWIPKNWYKDSTEFKYSHVVCEALHMAHRTRIHFYGLCLVTDWRNSGLPKTIAIAVGKLLNKRYGNGWLYNNESAQISAQRYLKWAINQYAKKEKPNDLEGQ